MMPEPIVSVIDAGLDTTIAPPEDIVTHIRSWAGETVFD
jgi:hypothetical protein